MYGQNVSSQSYEAPCLCMWKFSASTPDRGNDRESRGAVVWGCFKNKAQFALCRPCNTFSGSVEPLLSLAMAKCLTLLKWTMMQWNAWFTFRLAERKKNGSGWCSKTMMFLFIMTSSCPFARIQREQDKGSNSCLFNLCHTFKVDTLLYPRTR